MQLIEKDHLESVRVLLKERRVALSYKQKEAADRSGVNINTLRHFEQTGNISLYNLLKLFVLYRMDRRIIDAITDQSWWTLEEIKRSESKTKVR